MIFGILNIIYIFVLIILIWQLIKWSSRDKFHRDAAIIFEQTFDHRFGRRRLSVNS